MSKHQIAVVGGSGPQGRGLAYRFAGAGHDVTIGSRSAERAQEKAHEIAAKLAGGGLVDVDVDTLGLLGGSTNADAVAVADVVVLTVPWDGYLDTVVELGEQLAGKVVISCVNPLGFDSEGPFGLDVARSAAEETQLAVPGARVVGAFHHLAALSLWKEPRALAHEDVLVCGDDVDAVALVAELARTVTGHRGVVAGRLRLARQLEPLTAVLISINKHYKVRSGVAIVGVPRR
jgi:NADPH-dependent F420 reductase